MLLPADPVWSHVVKTVVGTAYADSSVGDDLVLAVDEASVEAMTTPGVDVVEIAPESGEPGSVSVVGRGDSIEYEAAALSDALITSLAPGSRVERAPNEYRYTIMIRPSG